MVSLGKNNSWSDEEVFNVRNVQALKDLLAINGCTRCQLGQQQEINGPVTWAGNPEAKIILIGEGPGLVEDRERTPFVGPAGILLHRIFASVGLDDGADKVTSDKITRTRNDGDIYLTNVVKCRPIAPKDSSKQNVAPTVSNQKICSPYWRREIELLCPKLLILCGKVAAQAVLDTQKTMTELAGKFHQAKSLDYAYLCFVIYHPAALLHSKKWPEKYSDLRKQMWLHIRQIRNFYDKKVLGKEQETYSEVPPCYL